MAIIDAFPFFNEIDLLKLRLRTLNPYVDAFVITESTTTFSGLPKKLFYKEYASEFHEFKNKIIYQVVDDVPNLNPFERDWYQRDQAKEIIARDFSEEDFLIYGDVDELPNPSAIFGAISLLSDEIRIAHLAQKLFYYHLNLQEVSGSLLSYAGEYDFVKKKDRKWLGTVVTTVAFAKESSITSLRNPDNKNYGVRIQDGGWHFSYMGGYKSTDIEDRIVNKIESAAHQELNTESIKSEVFNRIKAGKDIFHRRGSKFELQSDLSYLPVEVLRNFEEFRHLVKL